MYAAAKRHRLAYTTVWRAVQRQAKAVRAAQDRAVFEVVDAHKEGGPVWTQEMLDAVDRDAEMLLCKMKPLPESK